jgi:hypothetical protein
MNSVGLALIAAELLYESQRKSQNEFPLEEQKIVKQPPWVTARIDIPKAIRKGKTYEEILEIKKQIWTEQNKELQTKELP